MFFHPDIRILSIVLATWRPKVITFFFFLKKKLIVDLWMVFDCLKEMSFLPVRNPIHPQPYRIHFLPLHLMTCICVTFLIPTQPRSK